MAPLLEHGVTGVVTGSDLMALGAIRAARRWGLEVPRDVSVVGYDGTFISAFTDPSLTTLRQPIGPMGAAAADAIVAALDGDRRPHGAYHFAPELVVRESTGPAPHRGTQVAGR
jgi:alanine racemase